MATIPSHVARVFVAPECLEDAFLPEGPRSCQVEGREACIWVNIQTATDATQGSLHLYFWDNAERRVLPQPARPGFVLPTDEPDVVLLGREKELGLLDLHSGDWQPLARIPDDHPRTIINDGEVLPAGQAVIFGTKDVHFAESLAHLYLFTLADQRIHTLATGQICSNGKVLTEREGSLLLDDIDTPTKQVMRYRLDPISGRVEPIGRVIDLQGLPGFPDGMIDAGDGSVIIAMYNPDPVESGRAYRFDTATGDRLEEWTTPGSPRVTCPLLVARPDGVKLILTTATEGMSAADQAQCPHAGSLFVADTGFPSVPAPIRVRLGRGA